MKPSFKHFFLTAVLLTGIASAQVSTGTPSFSSPGGGPFDNVNLGNLNVHLSIPVLHKAGRGMAFTYDLSYDSSVWTPVTVNGVPQWQPATDWGWRGITEARTGYISNKSSTSTINECVTVTYSNYVYHDSLGALHPFAGAATFRSSAFHTCTTLFTGFTSTASDGSGYTLNVSTLGSLAGLLTGRGGKVVAAPLNSTSGAGTETDANGNQITVNSSGQFFDTLSSSTPVLTVSGAGTPSSPTKFTYTAPSGSAAYTMNYTQYTVATSFGTGISEYGRTSVALVSSVALPDQSSYSFTYEKTPGSCTPLSGTYSANCVTGRITSVTLATGGIITYTYSGGSNGIFKDGSTAGLTRVLSPATSCSSGGCWQYSRTLESGTPGPGAAWQTLITDPNGNATVISFAEDSTTTTGTTVATYNLYETQRLVYEGSTSGTLLGTDITCYNGNGISTPSTCASATVASPILRTTLFRYLPNASGLQAETDSTFDQFGLIHEVDEYGYSTAAVGLLIRKTITAYTAGMSNGIVDRPSSGTIKDGGNNIKAYTSYGYDAGTPTPTSGTPQHISISGSRGLLTSVAAEANGTTTLYRQYTYFDTGTLSTSTDVSTSASDTCTSKPSSCTTYTYSSSGSCGNSFVTSIAEPLSLTRSMTWDCNGGVMLSLKDENLNTSSTAYSGTNYTNYFWRPYSTTDQAGTTTNYFYDLNSSNQPFQTESKSATFNGGNSIVDTLTTNDGFGRTIFRQTRQGPSATNYDTVATCYDNEGRVSLTTLPYSNAAITSTTTACPSNPGTSYAYDALNRTASVSDSGGGSTAYTYNENDVLQTLTSPTQSKQQEYDALGRLTSVCEITSGTTQFPGASCQQNTGATGYLTQYAYDALGDLTNVTQNAQATSGHQTRAYGYDMLGRLTSETNPETNNASVAYGYDALTSDASCGTITSAGNMLKRLDAAQNATCYSGYDALHRVGSVTYPSTNTPAKSFVYDSATVNGTAMSNAKTRLAEAYTCTGTCSSKITDLGFSYAPTGQTTDVWELTPHSGTNYYYHVTSTPWPNGTPNTLSNLTGLPTITYSTDGEGRSATVSASSGQNPITAITFNAAGQATALTLGSSDTDAFTFYANTGRLETYQFNMGTAPLIDKGVLTWNPNGSLQGLVITDAINSTNAQTCTYSHDDLGRVSSANCGCSLWSQTFSYDPFGNITKMIANGCTAMSFQPTYDYTNNTNRIISTPFSYNNNNGNMAADNNHAYAWDTENKLTGIDSGGASGICIVYDALGRAVEQAKGSACTTSPTSSAEIVYSPSGAKLALMNGSALTEAFVALPGGVTVVYNASGLQYYRHPDWLGSSRLATTTSRTKYYDVAYAPFGEPYAGSGTQDLSFTGQNQDTEVGNVPGGAGGLYDFLYREHTPVQGRWLSPDPSGLAAANPSDPQTWNRYAYVGNRPLNSVDSLGLVTIPGCDPSDPFCGDPDPGPGPSPCDPEIDPFCSPGPILPPGFGGGGGGGGGGNPPPPPQRTGVWPGNETTGLPSGLGNSPFDVGGLLDLSPGTQCGNIFACDVLGSGSNPFGFGFQTTTSPGCAPPFAVPCGPPAYDVPWWDGPAPPAPPQMARLVACTASCNVQGIGKNVPSIDRVVGSGVGRSEAEACLNAKRDATQKAPPGTYARHCQCTCAGG
ncbi:MAG: RHS repeat domain-containing protein [Candidatus Sulfotelmatobacter sp.]